MSPSAIYISDPDMLASKLVEQEYLQSLGKIFLLVNSYNTVHNKNATMTGECKHKSKH